MAGNELTVKIPSANLAKKLTPEGSYDTVIQKVSMKDGFAGRPQVSLHLFLTDVENAEREYKDFCNITLPLEADENGDPFTDGDGNVVPPANVGWLIKNVFNAAELPLDEPEVDENGYSTGDTVTNWGALEGARVLCIVSHRAWDSKGRKGVSANFDFRPMEGGGARKAVSQPREEKGKSKAVPSRRTR